MKRELVHLIACDEFYADEELDKHVTFSEQWQKVQEEFTEAGTALQEYIQCDKGGVEEGKKAGRAGEELADLITSAYTLLTAIGVIRKNECFSSECIAMVNLKNHSRGYYKE